MENSGVALLGGFKTFEKTGQNIKVCRELSRGKSGTSEQNIFKQQHTDDEFDD